MMEEVSVTGFVMPVGNGAVGKSSLAKILDIVSLDPAEAEKAIVGLGKTKNLEFEFIPIVLAGKGKKYKIMMQLLVPPGQRKTEGDATGRSFEDVLDIYRFHIRRLDLVILTYKLNNRDSFIDLDEWGDLVLELCNPKTNFVLLGTHLDLQNDREVSQEEVANGVDYLRSKIHDAIPTWEGFLKSYEVSNLTGENIKELKRFLGYCLLRSREVITE